jgi:hypothetical protein
MPIQESLEILEKFEERFQELEDKFNEDKNHRWFVNYLFMIEKIRDNVRGYLNRVAEIIDESQEKYGEVYSKKDIKYHTDTAKRYCDSIKDLLRELVVLYNAQEDYNKIKTQWEITFSPLFRKIKDLRGRLLIIKRVLIQ